MNRRFLWLYFIGVPTLAFSAFFILFLLLKGSDNKNNSNNTTKLPLNNFTATSKIYSTTEYPIIYSTTKFSNFSKTTKNILVSSSTTLHNTLDKSTTTITPCTHGKKTKQCDNEIILSLDASSDILTPKLFQNQINSIKNYVINDWYNFTKVSLTWYNNRPYIYSTFGTIETEEEFKYLLTFIHQSKGSNISSLIKGLNKINVDKFQNISTMIFVSKIEESDILNAMSDAPILKNKGSLNFVVLGEIPNTSFLNLLNPNAIFKWDFLLDSTSKLSEFINTIRKCKDICVDTSSPVTSTLVTKVFQTTLSIKTSISLSTISTANIQTSTNIEKLSTLFPTKFTTNWKTSSANNITSTNSLILETTTTPFQCVSGKPINVCDGNIVMAIDATNDTLPSTLFSRQLDIVKNSIEPLWNDYKKIALAWYSKMPTIDFSYGTINNRQEFNSILDSINQYPGSSLSKLLSSINNLPKQEKKITIFVFISKISNDEIVKSIPIVSLLKKKGNINFIILGNVIPIYILDPLKATAVYSWDFSCTNAIQIVKFVNASMSCTTECSNKSTNNLINIVNNPSNYLNLQKIQKIQKSFFVINKCYNGIQSKKCLGNILLILDASDDVVTKSEFFKMISVVRDHFTNPFYNYSRMALSWYNSHSLTYFPFSTFKRKLDFNHSISLIKQKSGRDLSNHLKNVLHKYVYNYNRGNKNISTILFISNISQIDLLLSINYIKILKNFGTVNIIVMGNHINTNNLNLLNGSRIFMWDFSWKSTSLLISFLNEVTQCHIKCQENKKKIDSKYKIEIPTTTTFPPIISNYHSNKIKNENCNEDTYFVIDSSNNSMSTKSFSMQINLLQNNISKFIEDYYNVSLSWYDYYPHLLFPISTIHSEKNFNNALQGIDQASGSRLSKILKVLSSMALINGNKITAYIFVSENSTKEFNKSIEYVKTMKKYGNINFICLGNKVKKSDLIQLLPSNVFEWDFNMSLIESLVRFYNNTKTCENKYNYFSTTFPTTKITKTSVKTTNTTFVSSTTVPSSCINGIPVTKCDENIIIVIDISNNLFIPENFISTVNLIINNTFSNSINFKNVKLSLYNQGKETKTLEIFLNEDIFNKALRNITQFNDWRINEFFELLNKKNIHKIISTFIFISEERINELMEYVKYFNRLNIKGSLNLILLDSKIKVNKLKFLNYTNIIIWNMEYENKLKIVDFFKKSLTCINVCENTTISTTNIFTTPAMISTNSKTILSSTIQSNISMITNPTFITKSSTINLFTNPTITSTLTMNTDVLTTNNIFTTNKSPTLINQNSTTTLVMKPTTTIYCTNGIQRVCDNNIIFAIDSSNDLLTLNDFSKQIKVIKENLVSYKTNFNNIALIDYNSNTFIRGFNTIRNLTNFDEYIENIKQHNGWKLSTLFLNILKIKSVNMNPTSVFVFVSQANIIEINNSISFSEQIKDNGSLNIILLGKNLDTIFFNPLNPSKIFKWNMKDSSIPLLIEFFKNSQMCKEICNNINLALTPIINSTIQRKIVSSTSPSIFSSTTVNKNIITTTINSIVKISSTMFNTPDINRLKISNTKSLTNFLTTTIIPFTTCITNVYFVLDARGEVSNELFKKQINTLINIGQKFNMLHNNISININYNDNIFNMLFPIQPKSTSSLLTTSQEWKCALSFISENQKMYKNKCNKSLLVPFQKLSISNGPTIDKFLHKFEKDISLFRKTNYLKTSNEKSMMILFTLTGKQKEIDDSLKYIKNIKSKYNNFYFVIVKLSFNDIFNYTKISEHVLDFNYSDLSNFVTSSICN
uniref:VWFA domain-containing protein n=1 Tax=Strongyloides stercoralis TaxID=6248 RepID=A0A0K0DXX4_STRER